MEILILICLILVIILLLHEKVDISIKRKDSNQIGKKETSVPSVMGPVRTFQGKPKPEIASKSQSADAIEPNNKFDSETNTQSQAELEQELEEHEEWELNQEPQNPEDYVDQGVSHTEFKTVFGLLQKDKISEKEKKEAAGIVQKLQGTEMFNLLESTMDGASVKIAKLLDRSLNDSSQQDSDDFDIREFV